MISAKATDRKVKVGGPAGIFLTVIMLLSMIACEPETTIFVNMDNEMPPSFALSGPWWAVDFEIVEVPSKDKLREGKDSFVDTNPIWKISATPHGGRVKDWPRITYGVIPDGFVQTIPTQGGPPNLVEGKVYAAEALDTSGPQGISYFEIRNGKPVTIPPQNVVK